MKITGLIFLLTVSQAMADERILNEPPVPAFCKEAGGAPSGICVKGPTDYNLVSGKVKWTDIRDPNDPFFWQRQDKDHFGSDTTSGAASGGGESK